MAGIPLNTFKTFVKNVQRPDKIDLETGTYIPGEYYFTSVNGVPTYPPGPSEIGNSSFLVYTAPLGVTSVVLYAQVASSADQTRNVSLWHYRPLQSPVAFNLLLNNAWLPANDALITLGGKLVLETGDALYISSSNAEIITPDPVDPSKFVTDVKFTFSILESANQ